MAINNKEQIAELISDNLPSQNVSFITAEKVREVLDRLNLDGLNAGQENEVIAGFSIASDDNKIEFAADALNVKGAINLGTPGSYGLALSSTGSYGFGTMTFLGLTTFNGGLNVSGDLHAYNDVYGNSLTLGGGGVIANGSKSQFNGSGLECMGAGGEFSNLQAQNFETTMTVRHVLPIYADNEAALADGLLVDTLYKTATGEVRIVI